MTETIELKLSVTTNRAEGLVLGDLIAAQDGDLRAMRDTLAHFVVNGTGDYMDPEDHEVEIEGRKRLAYGSHTLVSRLTLGQLKFYSKQLQGSLRNEAVPPAKGTVSGSPSDTD